MGALGPVFRTYEPAGDRLVAVKAFRLDVTPETAELLAAELSRAADAGLFHPSIVEPLAAGVEGAIAYAAEEYVAAESLDVALRQYAPASIETVLPFITQLAGAIDFARAAGVGHGALHPRDIFVTADEARATGFGVVEALERAGLRAPVRRPYTAPERIDGQPWSTPADVFSLAAITYELLTGRRPSGLGAEIAPLTAGTPNEWMEALHGVLARAMQAEPDARFQTALAFASALEAAARGHESRAPIAAPAGAAARTTAAAAGPALFDAAPESPSAGAAGARALPGEQDEQAIDDIRLEREADEAHGALLLDERRSGQPDWSLGDEAPEPDGSGGGALSLPFGAAVAALDEAEARRAPSSEADERWGAGGTAPYPRLDTPMDDEPARRAVVTPGPRGGQGGSLYRPPVPPEPRRSRSHAAILALVLLGLVGGLAAGYALWGSPFGVSPGGAAPPSPQAQPDAAAAQGAAPGDPAAAAAAGEEAADAGSEPGAETVATPDAPTAAGARGLEPPVPSEDAAPPARPAAGSLAIRSTPRGAGVIVNGRWRGRTPLVLEDLPFARYTVRVVHSGYAAASERVALDPGDASRSLSFQLRRTARAGRSSGGRAPATSGTAASQSYTGAIYVDSRPRGARVSLDGKPVGVTPLRLPEVPIGSHVVRLELPDHRIWSSAATVTANEEVRVTGSLTPIP